MAPEPIPSPMVKKTRSAMSINLPIDGSLTEARKHRQSASWCGSPTEWDPGSSSGHVSSEYIQTGLIPADHQLPASLLDQGLTSKGQPKRPMNAFLIFARWRRPILKEENPSLSTGEISTLLSQDWASMDAVTRDFYSSHALALKATFQSRYPAYEYTRRPNNTRKRGSRGGKTYISRRDSSTWRSSDDPTTSTMPAGSALGLERIGPANYNGSLGWKRDSFGVAETEEDSDTDTNRHENDGSSSSQYSDHSQSNRPTSSTHSELPTPQLPYYPLTTEYGPPNELSSSAPVFYKPDATGFAPLSAAAAAAAASAATNSNAHSNNPAGAYDHSPHVFVSPYGWRASQAGPLSNSLMSSSPYSPASSLASFSPQLAVDGRLRGHGKPPTENGSSSTYMTSTQDYPVPHPPSHRSSSLIGSSPANPGQQLPPTNAAGDPSVSSFRSNAPYQTLARDWSTDSFKRYPNQRARTGPLNALGFLNSEQHQPSSSYKWVDPEGGHQPHSETSVEDEGRSEGGYRAGGGQVDNRGWSGSHQEEPTYLPAHSHSHSHSHAHAHTHSHYPSDQAHAYPSLPPPPPPPTGTTNSTAPAEPSSSLSSAPIGMTSMSGVSKYPANAYPSNAHSQSLISTSAPTTSLSSLMYSPYQQSPHNFQPLPRTSAFPGPKPDHPDSLTEQPSYHAFSPDGLHKVGPSDQDLLADKARDPQRHPYQTDPQGHAKYEAWPGSVSVGAGARNRTPMMDSYYYEP